MHYPLHITLLLTSLWIFRIDVNAAKSGISAEVLTSFAKNFASVLSTTLLDESQDPPSNQSSINVLKRIQEARSLPEEGHVQSQGSKISSKASFNRSSRYIRKRAPLNEGKEAFQDAYITNTPHYTKYYNSEAYNPVEFTLNGNTQVRHNQVNVDAPENVNTGDNSIDTDIKAASLHYSNQYHPPSEPLHQLANSNHYPQFTRRIHYHQLQPETPVTPQQLSTIQGINENRNNIGQPARLTRRQYHNLNDQGPFHSPYHPTFHNHPEFYYPHDRPIEGENQPVTPNAGQEENNPARLVQDQNQGQTAFAGYDYGPRFHYTPPYHGGFHHGFPGFYPGPYNGSFNNGYTEQNGGNGTGEPGQYGPPFFHGHRFGPYGPYNQPYYPNYYGNGRPVQPQNIQPENQGNPEQVAAPENGQGEPVNGTANGYPYGFPPHGPYYGGFPFPGYPLVLPYHRFGYGFHDHIFPKIKTVPYLNFYPGGYHNFPFAHWYPYGGFYPYNNNRPMGMPEKPMQIEKDTNANPEAAGPPENEAEVLSESKSEAFRSSGLNQQDESPFPGFVTKERKQIARRTVNELS
ncbi:hypothetical protein ANTRET_LOCUS8568 [Anthophora retusa]